MLRIGKRLALQVFGGRSVPRKDCDRGSRPKNFTRSAANDRQYEVFPRQMGLPQKCKSAGNLKVKQIVTWRAICVSWKRSWVNSWNQVFSLFQQ